MRADAGAAAGKIVVDALEDVDIPVDRVQQVGGEQAANRTADDQRTGLAHAILPRARCYQARLGAAEWDAPARSASWLAATPAQLRSIGCLGSLRGNRHRRTLRPHRSPVERCLRERAAPASNPAAS